MIKEISTNQRVYNYKRRECEYNEKRLYKIEQGKKIDGVCGGIAEYLDTDPTIIRLAWIFFTACAGSGIIAYIIAAIVMPKKSDIV